MGIIANQSFRFSIFTYLGMALGYVNMLIIFPLCLSPEDIGNYRLLIDCSVLFTTLAQFGTSGTIVRFQSSFKNNLSELIRYAFIVPTIGFAITSSLYFYFNKSIVNDFFKASPEFYTYSWLVPILGLVFIIRQILTNFSLMKSNIVIPNILDGMATRLLISIAGILAIYELITEYVLISSLPIIYGFTVIILFLYVKKLYSSGAKSQISSKSPAPTKKMLTYSFVSILGAGATRLVSKIDILMVSSILGLASTGIYSIALMMATIIEVPRRPLSQMVFNEYSKSWSNSEHAKIESLYKKSALIQLIIGGAIFLIVILNLENLFDLMPNGNIYTRGATVVIIIAFGKLFGLAFGTNTELLNSSKYYKWDMAVQVIAISVNIYANLLLIPIYGIEGAAYATLISIIVYNLSRVLFLYFKFKMQPFTIKNVYVSLILAAYFLIISYIPIDFGSVFNIIMTSFLASTFVLLVFLLKISPDLNQLIKEMYKKIRSGAGT